MAWRSWTWTLFEAAVNAEFVRGAVDVTAASAAAGQPHCEAVMIVVAAGELPGSSATAASGRTHRPR